MIYQLQFQTYNMDTSETSTGGYYWFESDLASKEFSDSIFSYLPMMVHLRVTIERHDSYANCIVCSHAFVDTPNNPDAQFAECLTYLRSHLKELSFSYILAPSQVHGTVVEFYPPFEKMFEPNLAFHTTSKYFKIVNEYTVYYRREGGLSGLVEYVVQNLEDITNLTQILYFSLGIAKYLYEFLSPEKVQNPLQQKTNHKLIKHGELRLAVAETLNIDFDNVQVQKLEVILDGHYLIVSTNLGVFEVRFNPNDELIFLSPLN